MPLFSRIHHVISLLWEFVRRHYGIALAGLVCLLVLSFSTKAFSQATGPSMFFSYAPLSMNLAQCKQLAYNKIADALEIARTAQISGQIETAENGVFGSGSGGHSAAVLCLPDNKVVVAIAAGPNQDRNSQVVNYLLRGF
jgi:hypothetical protein